MHIYIYIYTHIDFQYDFKPGGKPKTGNSLNVCVTKQSFQEMARGLDRPTGNRSLGRFQVDLSARMPGTTLCRRGTMWPQNVNE